MEPKALGQGARVAQVGSMVRLSGFTPTGVQLTFHFTRAQANALQEWLSQWLCEQLDDERTEKE